MNETITTILRSSGERTTTLAKELLEKEMGTVIVLEEKGQNRLKSSFQVALENSAPWTLMVDANLLVAKGVLRSLLKLAENTPSSTFSLGANVFDKLIGVSLPAGHTLYRTSLLEKALPLLDSMKEEIDPEKTVATQMALFGHPSISYPTLVVGLQNEEQYFRDIYKTAFLHAYKTLHKAHLFISHWQRQAVDLDCLVALHGFADGLQSAVKEPISAEKALKELNIKEKGNLVYTKDLDIASQMVQFQLLNC